MELMLACDLRAAADDCRFGLMEVKRGLIPATGGIERPAGPARSPHFTGACAVSPLSWTGSSFHKRDLPGGAPPRPTPPLAPGYPIYLL
jgi:enoyl-CoA hydratase/carnithine racemase